MADSHRSEDAASGHVIPERRHVSPHGRNDRRISWEEESSVVQSWLARGREEGWTQGVAGARVEITRNILLKLGRLKFGPPSPEVVALLETIKDVDLFEALLARLIVPSGWIELLAGSLQDE
jgi:hypothetical protein